MSSPYEFLRAFIQYVETVGIHDQYSPERDGMVMSPGVKGLVNMAYRAVPDKITPLNAASRMTALSPEHRNRLIALAEENKVIDLRQEFQMKMAQNDGARGLLKQLVHAIDVNDEEQVREVFDGINNLVKELEHD